MASGATKDWVADRRSYLFAWGIPTAALIVAIFFDPPVKPIVWAVSLTWMGVACLANASRCGRTHCYLTGPFFLLMAVASALHGFEVVWLGERGWTWLAITVGGGLVLLWWLPERLLGKYSGQRVQGRNCS